MQRKIIAVDIDEVLAEHYKALATFHNERYNTKHSADDYFTDHWSQVWNTSHEETERRAIEFHEARTHSNFEPIQGAFEALLEIHRNFDLEVVTVRREIIHQDTRDWLQNHYPGLFRSVHFISYWGATGVRQTKAEVCLQIGAEYLIDDSLEHCQVAAACGVQALLFGDSPRNQPPKGHALPEGVIRVKDWQSVVAYFAALKK